MKDKPKVIAYCPLHYGAEYLDAAIKSVEKMVDRIHIYYTPFPSYGHYSGVPCPETEDQLRSIAVEASAKVHWYRVRARTEGDHRSIIIDDCAGTDYDLILAFDGDEVFEEKDLDAALNVAWHSDKRYLGISGYVNFWRSFNHACYDGFRPIRIINLHNANGQGTADCRIYHFSCAQSEVIMRYKYDIHGHASEIRPGWLEETYFGWKEGEGDLHPVARGLWNAVPFPKETLPAILQQHPNFNKTII